MKLPKLSKDEKILVERLDDDLIDQHHACALLIANEKKAKIQSELTDSMEDHEAEAFAEMEAEIASKKFWFSVRKRYHLFKKHSISLREGFKIVDLEGCACGTDHSDLKKMILGMLLNKDRGEE